MKRWVITLAGGAVALLLALVVSVVFLLQSIDLRGRAAAAIEAATGRRVEVRGTAGFTIFPTLGMRAGEVSFANLPGARAAQMITAREVEIGVALMPLFKRDLQVTALRLVDPVIALEILPDGAPNWLIVPKARAPDAPKIDTHVDKVRLSGVSIRNGAIQFYNARTHSLYQAGQVDADIDLAGLDKPLSLKGSALYAGERVQLELSLATPSLLLANKPMNLAMTIAAAPLALRFEGVLQPGAAGLSGALDARGADLRRVAAWGGHPIGDGAGLKAFAVKGELVYHDHVTSLKNATVKLDDISGRGDFEIATARAKPYVSGVLELAALDLNPYLARVAPALGSDLSATPSMAPSAAPPHASGLQPIDVRKTGYDTTPLNYSGLRNVNANVELVTGALQIHKLRIDRARVSVVMQDGLLIARLNQMELYGGSGTGLVQIDARAEPLRFEESIDVDNVRALGFFSDALGVTALDAPANVTLRLQTEGRSQQDLISALNGGGAFYFSKGAFKGVDFGGLTRTVKNLLAGKVTGPNAQTPFDQFAATVRIERGVVAFRDFKLEGNRLRVLGQGSIDLGKQRLDLRFSPRTVFSRDEKTGAAKSTGIPAPFRASGHWSALKFTTDISGKGKREGEREICAVTRDC